MTTTVEIPAGRAQKLTELLERIHELSEPGTSGEGIPSSGDRLMLLPHDPYCRILTSKPPRCNCWQRCVSELLRLIYQLQHDDWALWRQLRMRYLQVEHVTLDAQYRSGHWRIIDNQTRRWRSLAQNEQVLSMSGGWMLALAAERQKKSEAWQDGRIKLARWNPEVHPATVQLAIERLAQTWIAEFEPYTPVVDTSGHYPAPRRVA